MLSLFRKIKDSQIDIGDLYKTIIYYYFKCAKKN